MRHYFVVRAPRVLVNQGLVRLFWVFWSVMAPPLTEGTLVPPYRLGVASSWLTFAFSLTVRTPEDRLFRVVSSVGRLLAERNNMLRWVQEFGVRERKERGTFISSVELSHIWLGVL